MFCTNCGREVKAEDAFCTNCGMKIEKEEKATSQKKKIKKGVFFLVIVCLIVSVVLVRNKQLLQTNKEQTTDVESKPSSIINTEDSETEEQTDFKIGNSIGNIINSGYSVAKDGFIYYVAPNEDMSATNIYKVKKGSSNFEIIFKGDYDIRALNIFEDNLYFINILTKGSNNDEVDNKIYKMNLDGSNAIVINDNDFAYDYDDMYVVNNQIYYVGIDDNVYKMDLNGNNRELFVETKTGYLSINNKYIIYNKENNDASDYITYIRPLDGGEEREINSSRIFTPIIEQDFIYYIDSENHLSKIPTEGGNAEKITDYTIYNINISNGFIYYFNYKDETNEEYAVNLCRLSLSGGKPEIIKELSYYSSFLNVVGDYIYYMDMDKEKAFINLININDFSEIKLYEWNYK